MRMRLGLFTLLLHLVSFTCWADSAPPLRVGVTLTQTSFGYLDPQGKVRGFNPELADLLCATLARTCEFKIFKFPDLIPALERGEIDFAPANFLITPERQKRVLFTQHYWRSTTSLIGAAQLWQDQDTANLLANAQLKVAVQSGSVQAKYLQQHSENQLVSEATLDAALASLIAAQVDLAMLPTLYAFDFLSSPAGQDFEIVSQPFTQAPLAGSAHIGVSPLQPDLHQQLNDALTQVLNDGRYESLVYRYFPFNIY
ncbi:polar amino acid transport system substrate-binding protein/histidine transport system substrate-binding protein [Allopseudospirillum japonicum]|uniref:Polar amino acid transport system substrate-binding protein/histidine transport system substrate-binding protein n=1 Tax=Allopseudospirillum japonicum TaxID=64971 RepID=A0A1H6RVT5_9GAMM|nr:transporter substrate-binding domain-containing protein [Allopseudospirillum japonicum]SEI55302.1 polar amino acid transport system substrate-binding protein/histidine transport system substrate-binding protein [Allopseudospirillum japonicum]